MVEELDFDHGRMHIWHSRFKMAEEVFEAFVWEIAGDYFFEDISLAFFQVIDENIGRLGFFKLDQKLFSSFANKVRVLRNLPELLRPSPDLHENSTF